MADVEERLKAHSALFSSLAELMPTVVEEAKDEEIPGKDPGDSVVNGFSVERVQSLSLSALQKRLKEKIENLHRKRNAGESSEGGGGGEEVMAQKKKKITERHKQKKGQRQHDKSAKKKVSGKILEPKVAETSKRPSVVDEMGRVVFSKFDFSTRTRGEDRMETNSSKKDYKKLLAKAEAAQKKLEEIKKTDERRGDELAKKLMWQKAVDMAQGTKMKDDPKLLKKSAKRVEKRKKKSLKEWGKRKELEKEAMDKRQAKRKANIEERKEQTRFKKMKRGKKHKGRTPGF